MKELFHEMSTFCLVALFMVADGTSVVNQASSHKTMSPQGSVSGEGHKSMGFTLGRTLWMDKTPVTSDSKNGPESVV